MEKYLLTMSIPHPQILHLPCLYKFSAKHATFFIFWRETGWQLRMVSLDRTRGVETQENEEPPVHPLAV